MDGLEQRLRGLFLEDLQDGLRSLREGAAELQRDGATDTAAVQRELFRVAHSLKGAGHSANVPAAVAICHRLEDAFARVQSGQRAVGPALFEEVTAEVEALAAVEEELRGGAIAPTAATTATAVTPTVVTPTAVTPTATPTAVTPTAVAPSTVPGGSTPPATSEPRLRVAVSTADELVAQVADLVDELSRAHVTDRAVSQSAARLVQTSHVLRLQSFADACAGLDRAAADVAAASGKQLRVVVEGGETRVDRSVAAALREPLLHLVRNAADHGIEPPEVRQAAGKDPRGVVRVVATVVDGMVELAVRDDGAGVDAEALRAAAARRGASAEADSMELAFVPGVSTAPELTVVSGRGVGLDAVRDRVERLGGAVRMSSTAGRGTEVVCTVPATLATVQVLLVRAATERVALPVAALERVQEVDRAALRDLDGRQVLLGAEPVHVVSLRAGLGLDDDAEDPPARYVVLRLAAASAGAALQVDAVDGEISGVLRPLPARAAGLPGVLGLLGLPGGELVPVLNPASCSRWALERTRSQASPPADPSRPRTVLLAEDTLTTRVLEQSILETGGYDVVAAPDGAEAWEMLQTRVFDIVVTDVDMPNMTGIELCRAIRASGRFPDLPVVLVTSLGSDEDRRRGAEAGADAYLVKSAFDRQVLLETVGRLL